MNGTPLSFLFKVELHCGNAYRALGAYREACEHYERARTYLNSQHDMKSAGVLYWGLGYSTYELIQQENLLADPAKSNFTQEEIERQYQRAISFLMQGRGVYQVSGDRKGEATVRLTIALVMLDYSRWRRGIFTARTDDGVKRCALNMTSLLQDAEEECRQVLMDWEELSREADSSSFELDPTIYVALAYLVQVYVERAALSSLDGYNDTANRERTVASYLFQEIFKSFSAESFLLPT